MYVILNMHHEDPWLIPTKKQLKKVLKQFSTMWTQIANYYIKYGDHLLFEGMNEPKVDLGTNEWSGGTAAGRKCINTLNQLFVDTVRATGGNNEKRCLLVTTFAAQASVNGVAGLVVPKDDKVMVSIHAYTPYRFTYYNDANWDLKTWDGSANLEIDSMLDLCYKTFVKKGIPVVITEFGAVSKQIKMSDGSKVENSKEVEKWVGYYVSKAHKLKINCIWWDNNYYTTGNELFGLFDRNNCTWYRKGVADVMIVASQGKYKEEQN